jgi:hypothetical protein
VIGVSDPGLVKTAISSLLAINAFLDTGQWGRPDVRFSVHRY